MLNNIYHQFKIKQNELTEKKDRKENSVDPKRNKLTTPLKISKNTPIKIRDNFNLNSNFGDKFYSLQNKTPLKIESNNPKYNEILAKLLKKHGFDNISEKKLEENSDRSWTNKFHQIDPYLNNYIYLNSKNSNEKILNPHYKKQSLDEETISNKHTSSLDISLMTPFLADLDRVLIEKEKEIVFLQSFNNRDNGSLSKV